MPKYFYKCLDCDHRFFIYHGMKELLSDCPQCEKTDSLIKEINKIMLKKSNSSDNKTGDLTKQYIEDNKELLKSYREELQGVNYDDDKNISD